MHESKRSLFDEAEVSQKLYDPLSSIYDIAKVRMRARALSLLYEITKVCSACERVSSSSTSSARAACARRMWNVRWMRCCCATTAPTTSADRRTGLMTPRPSH